MPASEIDEHSLAAVSEAYGEMQLGLDILNARIGRCCKSAFESEARALRAIISLTRGYGAEATIKLLEDKGWLPRSHYFGFLRGHLFARGARLAAHEALGRLPEAIREREVLLIKRDELLRARQQILERLDRDRLGEARHDIGRELSTGRNRD